MIRCPSVIRVFTPRCAGAFASNFGEEQSTEGWRPQTVLRGHGEIDIVSLAWSPDGDLLISCAIDHRILVWQTSTARKPSVPNPPYHGIGFLMTWSLYGHAYRCHVRLLIARQDRRA